MSSRTSRGASAAARESQPLEMGDLEDNNNPNREASA